MLYTRHTTNNTADYSRLLLFFNGWGMDSVGGIDNFLAAWQGIMQATGLGEQFCGDLLEFYDYTEPGLDFDLVLLANGYDQIIVLAWSLGVWSAAELLSGLDISVARAIAVNGTLSPVCSQHGLSPEIFRATADNWVSESARSSFNRRMCRGRENLVLFEQLQKQRPLADQRNELIALGERIQQQDLSHTSLFDLAVVCQQDKIFLPDNQHRFWQKYNIETMFFELAHWPGGAGLTL